MGEEVRELFREVAELPTSGRWSWYERRQVSTLVRDEVESLLSFDSTSGQEIAAMVRGAAEQFLLCSAPGAEDRRCGPYRLVRLLGNGGMGAVYLAERADGEVEQQVAIKFVRAGQDLPSLHSRFLRERQILASLNHPGIARLLDVGHSSGHPYLVMEFVEGIRIDQYAATLDVRDVLKLFVNVAEAVSYAHRNLVIHRDLKPSNILVDANGQPKLLDFGIAKLLDAPDETRTIDHMMTPEYASPEQLAGRPAATATDIYSLGAVLQRLLTGRSPRELAAIERDISRDLACILRKAMREEPEERYRSVDLMIDDVRAYLEHRPVKARRGNALYHARKFVRRRWLPMAASSLALVGVAGGLLLANHERLIAERRFQQVKQLSREFLDLDADIRALPGSTKARNRIVAGSLQYLERLAAEPKRSAWGNVSERDRDLALEIGEAYLKVARVQGVPVNSNLGQFRQARENLAKADAFVESVLAVPDFPQRRRALLISAEIARDAMILAQSENESAGAVALGHKVDQRLQALLASPGHTQAEAVAAGGLYVNVALSHSNLHQLDEASRYAHKAVEISRALDRNERQLGRALGVLANTARFGGDLEGALQAIRASRAIAEKLARQEDIESMLQLSAAQWREGLILGELNNISFGRPREARPLFAKALDIAETLSRKDPDDYTSRSYVSMAGRELADILRDTEPARALAIYDQTRRRLGEIKSNSKARREEVWLLTGSSYALRRLGRAEEAGQRIEAALELLRGLKDLPSPRIALGEECDAALRAQADHYAATGRTAAAIETYQELLEKVMAGHPQPEEDLRHANGLSRLYRDLGTHLQRAGRDAEAGALFQRRLALWRSWEQKAPANPFIRHELAACGFRCNWSSDSGVKWSAIPVGSGPGFRWEVVQFLKVYRNGGPLAGMLDHMTGTVDQITGIGQE